MEEGMLHVVFFSFLPGNDDLFSAFFLHGDSSRRCADEVLCRQLLSVDERQGQPVRKIRTKFFHDVQRQACPAGAFPMEKADGRIQADAFARAADIMGKQGIEKGKETVHLVHGRAPAPLLKDHAPGTALGTDEQIEGSEVCPGGIAFQPSQGLQVVFPAELPEGMAQGFDGGGQGRKRGVARLSHEYGPAVGHLAYQEGARKGGRLPGAVGRAVLGPAQEHVPPGRALDRRHETAALGKPGDRDAQCRTMFQKIRAATYPAKAGDGLECMQGDGPKALSVMVQLHTFPLFGEPGILRGDEQGIQIAFHPSSSHSLSR